MPVTVDEKRFNFAYQCLERWNHAEALRMVQSTNAYAVMCAIDVFCCLVCVEYECYQQLDVKDDEVSEIVDDNFRKKLFDLRNFWFHQQPDIEPRLEEFHRTELRAIQRCNDLHRVLGRVFREEVVAAGGTLASSKEYPHFLGNGGIGR